MICTPKEQRLYNKWDHIKSRYRDFKREEFQAFFFLSCILDKKPMDLKGKQLHQRGKKMLRNLFVQDLLSNLNLKGQHFPRPGGLRTHGELTSKWIPYFCQQLVLLGAVISAGTFSKSNGEFFPADTVRWSLCFHLFSLKDLRQATI